MERINLRNSRRMALVDELRGLAVVSMLAYHFCYDMVVIFGMEWSWFYRRETSLWQSCTSMAFIVIAGLCTVYSNRPFRRGFKILACALIITGATYFIYPEQFISFGILHFLGASMLIYAIFRRGLSSIHPVVGFTMSLMLAILTWHIREGYVGIGALTWTLPEFFSSHYWLFPLGFLSEDYFSADYFPLIPYFFVFMTGSYFSSTLKSLPEGLGREHIRLLDVLGRHSLLVYMTHQVIIFGVLSLIFRYILR